MMFDDLETTREQLIAQVRAVCKALKYIRSVTALDTLPRLPNGSVNPEYTKWCREMGIANTARVDIQMAAEYIRDELSYEGHDKGVEWKEYEEELPHETAQYTRRFDDLKTAQEELIDQIKAVCKALKYIRSVSTSDIRSRRRSSSGNTTYTKWSEQMVTADSAQADIETAWRCISTELSDENYDKNIEWKQLEKELERKRKQYTRKHRQQ